MGEVARLVPLRYTSAIGDGRDSLRPHEPFLRRTVYEGQRSKGLGRCLLEQREHGAGVGVGLHYAGQGRLLKDLGFREFGGFLGQVRIANAGSGRKGALLANSSKLERRCTQLSRNLASGARRVDGLYHPLV